MIQQIEIKILPKDLYEDNKIHHIVRRKTKVETSRIKMIRLDRKSIDARGKKAMYVLRFEVFIDDTVSAHNLYVNVRNTSLYPFSNLHLFIETTAPSGHTIRETFEITLSDDRGKWLGSGLGDMWDLQQIYKTNVRFAQRGKYTVEYQQGMRMDKLPFLLDVGLRIEVEK